MCSLHIPVRIPVVLTSILSLSYDVKMIFPSLHDLFLLNFSEFIIRDPFYHLMPCGLATGSKEINPTLKGSTR
jgi:hypothetical protein